MSLSLSPLLALLALLALVLFAQHLDQLWDIDKTGL